MKEDAEVGVVFYHCVEHVLLVAGALGDVDGGFFRVGGGVLLIDIDQHTEDALVMGIHEVVVIWWGDVWAFLGFVIPFGLCEIDDLTIGGIVGLEGDAGINKVGVDGSGGFFLVFFWRFIKRTYLFSDELDGAEDGSVFHDVDGTITFDNDVFVFITEGLSLHEPEISVHKHVEDIWRGDGRYSAFTADGSLLEVLDVDEDVWVAEELGDALVY